MLCTAYKAPFDLARTTRIKLLTLGRDAVAILHLFSMQNLFIYWEISLRSAFSSRNYLTLSNLFKLFKVEYRRMSQILSRLSTNLANIYIGIYVFVP